VEVSGPIQAPTVSLPGKKPGTRWLGNWVGSRPTFGHLGDKKCLALAEIRTPDRPFQITATIPTELLRHFICSVKNLVTVSGECNFFSLGRGQRLFAVGVLALIQIEYKSEMCHPRCVFKLYGEVNSAKNTTTSIWLNDGVY